MPAIHSQYILVNKWQPHDDWLAGVNFWYLHGVRAEERDLWQAQLSPVG